MTQSELAANHVNVNDLPYFPYAPGVDFKRTRSCTFASGVDTICPHSQELPLFVQFVVGARWFLSH